MRFEYRQLGRDGYCRVCQDIVERNKEKVFTFRSNGESCILCSWCVDKMAKVVERENLDGL